eukprot:5823924-Pyramimonas_sp.AAC.1
MYNNGGRRRGCERRRGDREGAKWRQEGERQATAGTGGGGGGGERQRGGEGEERERELSRRERGDRLE